MTTDGMFGEIDWKCINTIRVLAAEMVQQANSGHPGAPMGLAPLTHVLFTRFIRADPKNPLWMGRDRFVLSNGHACALQYAMLHLLGYDIKMEDVKQFRQLDSKLPGHPESHMTPGIEVSTGPLGQGVANGVGLAIAEANMAATFNQKDTTLVDNFTYVILGDGCMMEGISSEACSMAGHLGLGKLIFLYDDNQISIDGGTDLAFSENVTKRFEAYGFDCHVIVDGDHDLDGMVNAIEKAQKVLDRPSLISIKTTIGFSSKNQGTEKVHGAPLGAEDISNVKKALGLEGQAPFTVSTEVYDFYRKFGERGAKLSAEWNSKLQSYCNAFPEMGEELLRRLAKKLPDYIESLLPHYEPGSAEVATRKLSETLLNVIADKLPELIGGSADLTASNLTKWKTSVDFQKPGKLGDYSGRYLRFGVREHAMFGICNGLSAYSGLIPFASTFLNFISYGLGSVRLSCLSHQQVIYIMTHDSIGLGEDGPTHQPIETLAGLRALPNILVMRPADGNEVSGVYWQALNNSTRPSVICLSRQNLPQLTGSSIEGVAKGAYILQDLTPGKIDLILVSTGSEVSICAAAAKLLTVQNISVRLVSMPCWELFDEQSPDYRQSVFPPTVPVISVEALSTFGWQKYAHLNIGMTTFGASGPYKEVYRKFGLTAEAIAEKAQKTLQYYSSNPVPNLHAHPLL
jgi:transketolase